MSANNEKEKDNRLFPNFPLYCEGRERSRIRGWLHFIACVTFFPSLLFIYLNIFFTTPSDQLNYLSFFACFTNFMVIYVAHMISAFYHITDCLPHNEIFFQRTDIIGANCYVASSYLPMALLLFPSNIGATLLTLSTSVLGWNMYGIIHSSYEMYQPMYIILLQILFFPFIYTFLSSEELILNCTGILSLVVGAGFLFKIDPEIYVNKERQFFTQFDMYHAFSLICLTTTCLMNYSIFNRTYLIHNEIFARIV